MGAMARPATTYAIGAAWPLSATSKAADAVAVPEITISPGGTRSGMSAASSLPIARASQKPDVIDAASSDRRPTDSRCEGIHPPTPVSTAHIEDEGDEKDDHDPSPARFATRTWWDLPSTWRECIATA